MEFFVVVILCEEGRTKKMLLASIWKELMHICRWASYGTWTYVRWLCRNDSPGRAPRWGWCAARPPRAERHPDSVSSGRAPPVPAAAVAWTWSDCGAVASCRTCTPWADRPAAAIWMAPPSNVIINFNKSQQIILFLEIWFLSLLPLKNVAKKKKHSTRKIITIFLNAR